MYVPCRFSLVRCLHTGGLEYVIGWGIARWLFDLQPTEIACVCSSPDFYFNERAISQVYWNSACLCISHPICVVHGQRLMMRVHLEHSRALCVYFRPSV